MRLADPVSMVRAFLLDHVDVPVSTIVPNPRPESFIRMWRNGGSAVNRVLDAPQITVDSYAPTDPAAAELARVARESFLNDYSSMPLVRGVSETTGVYFTPDPDTNTPRYRFTMQLMVRATRA